MNKLLLPLLLLLLCSCHSSEIKPKFYVSKPVGWIRKDTVIPLGNRIVYMANPKSTEEITIVDGHHKKLEDFMKVYVTELYKRSTSIEVKDDGDYKDNGKIIQWIQWRAKFNYKTDTVDQKTFFIPNGPDQLIVSFISLPDGIPQMQPIIEEVLRSIKFK